MTAHAAGERAFGDLTARARIRDAALRLFADRGVDGATIRDIAKAAGVSAGLVRHHFGSKEGLRDACDAYALEQMTRIPEEVVGQGRLASPGVLSAVQPTVLLQQRYLARGLLDGSRAAASMFDGMVELGEQYLARHHPGITADPHAYAALLVAMQAGVLVMHDHLSRALGTDILSPEGHLRMSRASVDLYSQPLLSPEMAAQARAAIDREQGRPPATSAEGA
jgi:TetR/AcrR family transcriptional regulator, regulator of cefoperazone and chloramphenicol sensitivity